MIEIEIGRGKYIWGDCLEIMPTFPDNCFDFILCDLPYGITANRWDSSLDLVTLWNNYTRICKGAVALTASQPFTSILVTSNIKHYKHEWVWVKNRGSNFANTTREPMKEHESILVFSKGKWTFNRQMQQRSGGGINLIGAKQLDKGGRTTNYGKFKGKDITLSKLRVPSSHQKFNCEVGLHPTQKPVALFKYLVKTYTNPGDVILDNCAGSGTTAVAAESLGRRWICIEKDRKYFDIGVDRVSKFVATWEGRNVS